MAHDDESVQEPHALTNQGSQSSRVSHGSQPTKWAMRDSTTLHSPYEKFQMCKHDQYTMSAWKGKVGRSCSFPQTVLIRFRLAGLTISLEVGPIPPCHRTVIHPLLALAWLALALQVCFRAIWPSISAPPTRWSMRPARVSLSMNPQ